MKNSISLVGAAILGGMITLTGNYLISGNAQTVHIVSQQSDAPQKANKNFQLTTNTDAAPTNFSEAAERVMPAVVNITAIKEHTARSAEEKRYYEYFGQPRASEATGSGVIISAKGYIVTNNHVIKGSNKVEITLYDKRKFTATLIGLAGWSLVRTMRPGS